jgi:uncharacterized membrane protein YgcG
MGRNNLVREALDIFVESFLFLFVSVEYSDEVGSTSIPLRSSVLIPFLTASSNSRAVSKSIATSSFCGADGDGGGGGAS